MEVQSRFELLIILSVLQTDPLDLSGTEPKLEPPPRIELRSDAYKATVLPLNYRGKLVGLVGFEPTRTRH